MVAEAGFKRDITQDQPQIYKLSKDTILSIIKLEKLIIYSRMV